MMLTLAWPSKNLQVKLVVNFLPKLQPSRLSRMHMTPDLGPKGTGPDVAEASLSHDDLFQPSHANDGHASLQ